MKNTIPMRVCTAPGCTNRVRKGRCPKHQGTHKPDAFADVYSSRAWTALSREVREQEPICRRCRRRPTEHADHILAMHDGGAPLARLNVQGLCGPCHAIKGKEDRRRRRGGHDRHTANRV